jgi:hypothetical protein
VVQSLGLSAGTVALLPSLESLAQGAAAKRLIFFYSSNGTVAEHFFPTPGPLGTLPRILEPLESYKSRMTVVDNLNMTVINETAASNLKGHYGGMNSVLTGQGNVAVSDYSLAMGVSVDQYLAEELSKGLPHKSLELGILVDDYNPTVACLSWRKARDPIYPENDTGKVFNTVFKNAVLTGGVDPAIEARKSDRLAILDVVRKDVRRLNARLGSQDRQRLEAHLTSIEELEKSLKAVAPSTPAQACSKPANVGTIREENDNIPLIGKTQMDLLVMALACDLTRVGTIQYGRCGAGHRFNWLGPEFRTDPDNGPNDSTPGIHALAHNERNATSREKLARCHRWYAEQLKYLLDKLSAIPEGSGSMLDNTLVVWVNEMGTGSHSLDRVPYVLLGNVNGYFKTGRAVRAGRPEHNQLLLSICHAFGRQDATFGDARYCPGPLAGLT